MPVQQEAPKPKSRRVQNAVGSIVRTLVIAALVAAAVAGGRYGYQWYQDRDTASVDAAIAVPTAAVLAPDARYITVTRRFDDPVFDITTETDLATGDAVATSSLGGPWAIRSGEVLMRDAAGNWQEMSDAEIEANAFALFTMTKARILTITDVLPPAAVPFTTITSDTPVQVPGVVLPGETVFELGEPEASESGDGQITASGNSDPVLDDVVSNLPPAATPTPGSTAPVGGTTVEARKLVVSVDRAAFVATDRTTARSVGLFGTTPVTIEMVVDSTGVIRSMTSPADVTVMWGSYTLDRASTTGVSPLRRVGLETDAAPNSVPADLAAPDAIEGEQ